MIHTVPNTPENMGIAFAIIHTFPSVEVYLNTQNEIELSTSRETLMTIIRAAFKVQEEPQP